MKTMIRNFATNLLSVLLVSAMLLGGPAAAAAPETEMVAEARELVDSYYGKRSNLITASALLEQAYKANPRDAHVFVQAARITIMGGHLSFNNFEQGTWERYERLLDKAFALDPTHVKVHILKAEVFNHQRKYDKELESLNKARALGTSDPWVLIGFGRYYTSVDDLPQAIEAYSQAERRGPGTTSSERKAYVSALRGLGEFRIAEENAADKALKYAAMAQKAKHPDDAWTPHGYAEDLLYYNRFDEALLYAREALKVMEFGAGRLTLAAALYAKAASQHKKGVPLKEVRLFIDEAESYGFSKERLMRYFITRSGLEDSTFHGLMPTLDAIVRASEGKAPAVKSTA